MSLFFRCHFAWSCHGKISSRPKPHIVRQCSSGTIHKIDDTLKARKFHIIAVFIFFLKFIDLRRIAGKQPSDHKLQKSVFCRKFRTAAKTDLAYFINRIPFGCIFSGKAHFNMVFPKPLKKTGKTCVHAKYISTHGTIFSLIFKCCLFHRIRDQSDRMMAASFLQCF